MGVQAKLRSSCVVTGRSLHLRYTNESFAAAALNAVQRR